MQLAVGGAPLLHQAGVAPVPGTHVLADVTAKDPIADQWPQLARNRPLSSIVR